MRRRSRPYAALLRRYLGPQRGSVLLLAGLVLGGIALQLANPQVIRYFLDSATHGGSDSGLLMAAALFIILALTRHGLALAAVHASQRVAWAATNWLRRDLLQHILRLDLGFHKRHAPGELIDRIDGDAAALGNFFSEFVVRIAANAVLVAGILALLYIEDVRAGAALTAYSLATVVLLAAVQPVAVRRWAAARQVSGELYGFIEERLGGVEDLRSAGAVPYTLYQLNVRLRAWLQRERAANVASSAIFNFTNVLTVAGYAVGLALGVYLYTRGQATVGAAYLIVSYVGMLAGPLQVLRYQARDLQRSAASIDRIDALLELQPRVADAPSATAARHLPPGALAVEFAAVEFAYEDEASSPAPRPGRRSSNDRQGRPNSSASEPDSAGPANGAVLHDVSFVTPAGRVLGILGRTGSGKTTLTRLLFRLYDPASGGIRLGGVDVRAIPRAELRARVGMVTQDVQLFSASIRDNLTFFNPALAGGAVERALRALDLWDWVQALPNGLDTRLGPGGHGLSAGEAQLLAFARVFLKDPGLVILDEASSRLDPATESRLEHAVDRLFSGRTGLIVAHRLRTVQRADDILILEAGRLVEFGPRAALAADPRSRFHNLLQTGLEEVLA